VVIVVFNGFVATLLALKKPTNQPIKQAKNNQTTNQRTDN
jgi:hypothetical protein